MKNINAPLLSLAKPKIENIWWKKYIYKGILMSSPLSLAKPTQSWNLKSNFRYWSEKCIFNWPNFKLLFHVVGRFNQLYSVGQWHFQIKQTCYLLFWPQHFDPKLSREELTGPKLSSPTQYQLLMMTVFDILGCDIFDIQCVRCNYVCLWW